MRRALRRDRHLAQSMVEYAIILILVSVAAIVILAVMGQTLINLFSNVVGGW